MSNLVNLVRFRTKELSEQNRQEAYIKCQEADSLVAEALSSGNQKILVKRAVGLYKESLDLYSYQVKPYLGLAYIMYSMDEPEDAIGLLNSARKVEPHHPQVNQMLEIIIQKHKALNNKTLKKADSSLSDKLKNKKISSKDSFFEKISAVFMTALRPKNKSHLKKVPDDFAMLLNETKKKMNIPGHSKPAAPVHKFITRNSKGEKR